MEIDHLFLEEAKAAGHYELVQTLLVSIGQAVNTGHPVLITWPGQDKAPVMLTSFGEFQTWLNATHADMLEL